ncbi:acyltransferase family protein [Mucilaginibacter lacusdianchii]|uniref:acyltransferase family protein n=1 Tax=Mucilaginibacter lacusdianchii TaxID=2684211 RepID=UPI00131E5EB0|nr:acyltransferase [Mucilaginibacter sp. JXJ CY 39]
MPSNKFNWELLSFTRFLLALIVLAEHITPFDTYHSFDWYKKFGAFEAILGFLLISGFSIGKSINKSKESYFKRRIARIYPVYIASILTSLLVNRPDFSLPLTGILFANLLFLTQIFTTNNLGLPSWTLTVEVWLYALAPALLKLSYKWLNVIIYGSFTIYCIYTCGRTIMHWPYYFGTQYAINLPILAFVWVAGFALAIYPEKRKFNLFTVAFLFASHILLTTLIQAASKYKHHQLGLFFKDDLITYIMHAICLAFVFFIVFFNHKFPKFSRPTNKLFNTLGNISYPLYLIHIVVFVFIGSFNFHFGPVLALGAIFYAWLLYWIFDSYSKKRKLEVPQIDQRDTAVQQVVSINGNRRQNGQI